MIGDLPRMPRAPFTVGLVQESAGADRAANLERAVAGIRDAHRRGARVICLQELFNAPYFCKSLKVEHFGIAEPIPGPVTNVLAAVAKDLEVVLVAPVYERQASGLYRNSAAVIDAFHRCEGNLRNVWFELYDLYERRRLHGDRSEPCGARR